MFSAQLRLMDVSTRDLYAFVNEVPPAVSLLPSAQLSLGFNASSPRELPEKLLACTMFSLEAWLCACSLACCSDTACRKASKQWHQSERWTVIRFQRCP